MTTLCIVDMQPFFSTAKHCLDAVCHQVKLAKKRKAGIVVLEYSGCGTTYPEIKILLASYKHVTYITKHRSGGGSKFLEAAKKAKIKTNKVRFVGVNRGYCVFETIKEITNSIDCRAEIVGKATWCGEPNGLRKLRRVGKVI